jgi:uncharacterized protein
MSEVPKILHGQDCSKCGQGKCRDFEQQNSDAGAEIKEYLSTHSIIEDKVGGAGDADADTDDVDEIQPQCKGCGESQAGVLDSGKADFSLGPIPGEPSCREDLYPLARFMDIGVGDVLKYRPLGCPVVHFAKVIKYSQGIATVHLAGPHRLLGVKDFSCKDAGICMVTGFEGAVIQGRVPDVGETIRFVPSHCRMQQVHSGVIVHSEGSTLRIEGIDLLVWR